MTTPATPFRSSLPDIFFTDELPRLYPTVFVYGAAGTGKTNAARTCLHLKPLAIATEEGNTKGMSTLADLHVACLLLSELDSLVAITAELSSRAKPGELYYKQQGPFNLLWMDSLTGIGYFLEDAVKKLKSWDMIWDSHAGGGKDPRSAYPYIAEKGRQVVRKLMALPVPLVLTCREQLFTEGEGPTAITYPVPELPGQKLPKELPGWPEATVRLRLYNGQRVLQTQNEGNVIARIRLKEGLRLPQYVKPNLGALIRLLQNDDAALKELTLDAVKADGTPAVPKTPQQLAAEAAAAQRTSTGAKTAP